MTFTDRSDHCNGKYCSANTIKGDNPGYVKSPSETIYAIPRELIYMAVRDHLCHGTSRQNYRKKQSAEMHLLVTQHVSVTLWVRPQQPKPDTGFHAELPAPPQAAGF